jgi:hypothetical protein
MIDWHSELVSTRRRIAELEEKIALQERRGAACSAMLLDILQSNLRHAESYRCVVEQRIAERSTEITGNGQPKEEGAGGAIGGNISSENPKEIRIQRITIRVE